MAMRNHLDNDPRDVMSQAAARLRVAGFLLREIDSNNPSLVRRKDDGWASMVAEEIIEDVSAALFAASKIKDDNGGAA
jgi:hypothetical protein